MAGGAVAVLLAVTLAALGKPVWGALAAPVLGAVFGAVVAIRRRWSDADVALFLDARLSSDEVITSALGGAGSDDVLERVTESATRALAGAPRRVATPRILARRHALIVVALTVVALSPRIVPAQTARVAPPPPPARVTMKLDELRKVEELAKLVARTDAERARREALAEKAHALAEKTAKGVDQREALNALGKLRDSVHAERADARMTAAGRRAASRALGRHSETASAADALARGDLVAFDAEMDRLARSLEAAARKTALAALDEARETAIAQGDAELAGALAEQQRLLKRRAEDSEALRELSRLLGDSVPKDVQRQLARLGRSPGQSAEALAEALAGALAGLSPEERERLARKLAEAASAMKAENATSTANLEELAKALKSKEARDALQKALKALANGAESGSSASERALAAAELSVDAAARRVAGGQGDGSASGKASTSGAGDDGNGSSGSQASRGGGEGPHAGSTPAVAASSFTSRAAGAPLGGIPLGAVPGVSPAAPVAVEPETRAAALEAARSREVGAVERSNVPREYREQVGRYFAP